MSNGSNRPALTNSGSWQVRNGDGDSSPDHEDHWNRHVGVSWQPRLRPNGDRSSPWRLFEQRVRTGPFGLVSFPSRPHSPVRILIIDTDRGTVNPGLRRFLQDSPERIRGEWNLELTPQPEDPGLSEEEFKKAMKKVRKHVHNPTHPPRRRAWGRGLFSNRNTDTRNNNNKNYDVDVEEGDGKEERKECCSICLEAFVSNEQVSMTPCNHMFHNDCLVPWVKSRGDCPVCRFALCETAQRRRDRSLAPTNNYGNVGGGGVLGAAGDEDWDDELFYLLRAMEEAFNWVNLTR